MISNSTDSTNVMVSDRNISIITAMLIMTIANLNATRNIVKILVS
jgi:hypothetical protein